MSNDTRWTPSQDALLRKMVAEFWEGKRMRPGGWDSISERLGRSVHGCRDRWKNIKRTALGMPEPESHD